MRSRPMVIVAAVAAISLSVGLGAVPALAHHSYAGFDRKTKVTVEGDIISLNWSNPHVTFTVMAADGRPMRIEWRTVRQLRKAGVGPDVLKAGDHLVIVGSPHKDPKKRIVTLLKEVRRPADGWAWYRHRKDRPDAKPAADEGAPKRAE